MQGCACESPKHMYPVLWRMNSAEDGGTASEPACMLGQLVLCILNLGCAHMC